MPLLNKMSPHVLSAYQHPIVVVTDPEGNKPYFDASLEQGSALCTRLEVEHVSAYSLSSSSSSSSASRDIAAFACIGDISDKNPGDLRILCEIKQRVETTEEHWALIAGNRDDNKLRFLAELTNEPYIQGFMRFNKAPYWDDKLANTPLDFYRKLSKADAGVSDQDLIERYETVLSFEDKRVVITKWMLEKTMGAPGKFEFRRQELQVLRPKLLEITDQMIIQSFIEEMVTPEEFSQLQARPGQKIVGEQVLPDEYMGVMRWYIDNSDVMLMINHTLYSHAGMPTGVLSGRVDDWVNAKNQQRKAHHVEFVTAVLSQTLDLSDGISKHPAIQGSLAKSPERPDIIQSFNSFDEATALTADELRLLSDAGIHYLVHGHQPVLTQTPRLTQRKISHEHAIYIMNCDTSMIGGRAQMANGTVVSSAGMLSSGRITLSNGKEEIYCIEASQREDILCAVPGKTLPRYLGRTLDVQLQYSNIKASHSYEIAAHLLDNDGRPSGNYLLVCREKPGNSPYLSVPDAYGIIAVTEAVLIHLIRDKDSVVEMNAEGDIHVIKKAATVANCSSRLLSHPKPRATSFEVEKDSTERSRFDSW